MIIKRERKSKPTVPPNAGLAKELMITVETAHIDITAIIYDPNEERKWVGNKGAYGIHFALTVKEEQELFKLLLKRRVLYGKSIGTEGCEGNGVCLPRSEEDKTIAEKYPKSTVSSVAEKFTNAGKQDGPAPREVEPLAGHPYSGQTSREDSYTVNPADVKPQLAIGGGHLPLCKCDKCYTPKEV
jgi:hypothetical protein